MTSLNERPSMREQARAMRWLLRVLVGAGVALVGVEELASGAGPSAVHAALPVTGPALAALGALEVAAGVAVLCGRVRPAAGLIAALFAVTSVAAVRAGSALAPNLVLVGLCALVLDRLDRAPGVRERRGPTPPWVRAETGRSPAGPGGRARRGSTAARGLGELLSSRGGAP